MENNRGLRIAVVLLSLVVAIETAALIGLWRAKAKKPARPVVQVQGKIAIVLDDWGYSLNNLPLLQRVRAPLTLSILPGLAYSEGIAQEAHGAGREVILHLPMEPHERVNLEKHTILTSMGESEITGILDKDLSALRGASGISNHMGSLATEDARVMAIIFKDLKKRGMYFFDSFVTPRSVCKNLAQDMHLDFARRDIFIDNQSDPGYIRQQLLKLKADALLYGKAIGIGHDHSHTLEVLAQVIPEFKRQGIEFVFVSDLARQGRR
jgi:hypothetical protein